MIKPSYDAVEAAYVYASQEHGGQGCPLYRALCRVLEVYTPPFRGVREEEICCPEYFDVWDSMSVGEAADDIERIARNLDGGDDGSAWSGGFTENH